jgi:hypothetical protein
MMKRKSTYFILVALIVRSVFAQEFSLEEKIEAEIAFNEIIEYKLNSLSAIENYLYYTRGVNPGETSMLLDKYLALAEHHQMRIELYNRKYGNGKFLKISGYWRNLRIKLVHSYQKELAKDMDGKLSEMVVLLDEMKNALAEKYRLSFPKKKFLLDKALYYTHYLSFLYIASQIEKGEYFNIKLTAATATYKKLIENFKKIEFADDRERKRFEFLVSRMEQLMDRILLGEINPDNVLIEVNLIHNGMIKLLAR